MTPSSYLIKFDRKLSEILVDIDHDFSSWDDVALTNLYPLQEYLVESKDDFRMAVVEDNESYKYVRIVENIMLTFNNYILWAGKHQDIIKDGDEKDEKRILVEAILFEIVFEWTCWVKGSYHFSEMEIFTPIVGQSATLAKKQTTRRLTNEERKMQSIMRVIIGESKEDKIIKYNMLARVFNGTNGLQTAALIKADKSLNLLVKTPNFEAMESLWNVQGSHSAITNYITNNTDTVPDDEYRTALKIIKALFE